MSGALEGIYEPGVVDPGFPVSNSTKSFWQSTKHPRANHQSAWPTEPVDIAIIGSGISGMSLARTLLSKRPDLRITLLEARDLCSGATARNGGHIKTMTFLMWEERKQQFGIEEAVRISAFEHSHLEAMAAAIKEDDVECDLVSTEGVEAYFDKKLFDQAVAALEDMRAHAPHLAAKHKIYTDKDHLQQAMKLSPRCVGAITVPAASVWPYKWITRAWNDLIDQAKLNVQTHTTVREIIDRDGDEFAIVKTDRGDIKARKVVHATNAWLGHLLPELRPYISPVRGNVVHYGATKGHNSALGLDSGYSLWLRYGKKDYDYLIQRKDGGIVVGRANTGRTTTGDDSETDLSPMAHLRGFGQEVAARPVSGPSSHIDHAWSGILAFSQDGLPFAGKLSTPGRSHQWVCGGYHATGMIKAFRTSQAVAQMLLGEDVDEDFPRSMLVTEERLRELGKSLDRGNAPNFRARARL
ncbi:hypothetical protein FDECE_12510 [Fusarium decemcellulare]|nr:hypothetical protein FDECE_12510 [Fusarium decemcellulare]